MCPIKIELLLQLNVFCRLRTQVLLLLFCWWYFFFFLTRSSVSLSSQDPIVRPETKLVESQQDGCCQGDVCLTESICSCPCARGACLFWWWRGHWHARCVEYKVNLRGRKKKKKTWHAWNHVTSHSGLTVVRVCHALQWARAGDLSVWIWCYTCCCEHEVSVVAYLCSAPSKEKKTKQKDKTGKIKFGELLNRSHSTVVHNKKERQDPLENIFAPCLF